MSIARIIIAFFLVTLPQMAIAEPFYFEFSGDFDSVGQEWPGASTFTILITVDNGGDNPFDTFNVSDVQRTELISGNYEQTWDRNLGGTDNSSAGDFWQFIYDGTDVVWSMAEPEFGTVTLIDGTDNQGGQTDIGFVGIVDGSGHVTWIGTSLSNSNNFNAVWSQEPNIFVGSRVVFLDVPSDYWALTFINKLAEAGITSGCGSDNYCPENLVTRAQLAVFLERGMRGGDFVPPSALGNVFLDVAANDFAASFIEQLFFDGISGGCGGNNYCPTDVATRAQMAVFLLRAKYGTGYTPPPAVGLFNDADLSYWAVAWIEQLAVEGITSGCGGGRYCPDHPVTRAQMAVFLVRTFAL